MAKKAREAFRTISEVANWLDIPAHVLRFWESKFTQIKPIKRAGGRRYYRPADMRLIGGIKQLLHDDGLTIRGVQKMLKEDGVKPISDLSPPLDMPSEEEGAARRDARRARRKARKTPESSETDVSLETTDASTDSTDPEVTEDAPFLHVEDDSIGGDNVVPLVARDTQDDATDAEDSPVEQAAPKAADPAAETIDEEPQSALGIDAHPPAEDDVADETATDTPGAVANEATAQAEASDDAAALPDPKPTPEPPAADIPEDPKSDAIQATRGQKTYAARLKRLRQLDPQITFEGSQAEIMQGAYTRLKALRDRMAAGPDTR